MRSLGFTLIELLLVLFIVGLAYGISAPLLGEGSMGLELKTGARQLAAGLRQARAMAVSQRIETTLSLDIEAKAFRVGSQSKVHTLSDKLELSLFTAQSELQNEKVGNIRFFPDGSSTGGRITLSGGKNKILIDVSWLTGRISIS
jgi:general secretion pathway protein H